MTLVEQRKLVQRRRLRKGEIILVLTVLFGCGYGAGYIHASAVAQRNYTAMSEAHQQDIARLQNTQAGSITAASAEAKEAARAAAAAAAKADATAEKVERAAAQKGTKP